MCGIAGLLGTFTKPHATALGAALAHRGPDGAGVWRDAAAGMQLVHRRLSIIDTSTAASQPMESADGRYVVVFNGEIYNFKKIVEYLQKNTKYKFNPNSDTAVLAPLFDLEGPAMLERLEGMFALAIWDKHERQLFVARDHAGIKPLYYAETPQGLAFASELKALRPVLADWSLDTHAMAEYLTFLWTPGERTMLSGVKKLRPGHFMLAAFDDGVLTTETHRWYMPPQAPLVEGKPQYDTTKTPAHLLKLLDAVVAEQCTSDVPVGAFLSGGVDSSAIVASMVATGNRPSNTYCIGFEGAGMAAEGFEDDMAFATSVATHLKVPFTPLVVEMEPLLERLPSLPFMLDEPTADPAPLVVPDIAARAKADGIKVLLGGAGGDDVFSGYRRHQTARLRETLNRHCERSAAISQGISVLCKMVARVSGAATSRRLTRLADLLRGDDERFLLHAFTTNSQPDAARLLRHGERSVAISWNNALTSARDESHGQSLLNRLLYIELFGFLPDHNLNYNDKAAMLAGVEGRVPLTDRRLLDFMADVPPTAKLTGGGWTSLHQTAPKAFFKSAVSTRLPHEVLSRSKAGFGAPIRQWLTTGKGSAMMEDALFGSAFAKEHFHQPALQAFWKATCDGHIDGTYTALAAANMVWWWEGMGNLEG
ncbi:MAG: asparagine synthase (glutamine-hydrolyzing) [Alphaproteobacteria bacterium]